MTCSNVGGASNEKHVAFASTTTTTTTRSTHTIYSISKGTPVVSVQNDSFYINKRFIGVNFNNFIDHMF